MLSVIIIVKTIPSPIHGIQFAALFSFSTTGEMIESDKACESCKGNLKMMNCLDRVVED